MEKRIWQISVFLLCILQTVHTSWWYLGIAGPLHSLQQSIPGDYRHQCARMHVLTPRQRELCGKSRHILDVIQQGASMGIEECQFQFQDRRWNCTTYNNTSVFGKLLQLKSREKAYIYAISSSGVMSSVTRACAKGELNICGCDPDIRHKDTKGNFMWGGCSHNTKYGERFTIDFVDSKESNFIPDGLMNLWNNAAGRKAIKQNLKLLCKCHGVSGSCSVKICWQTMANFRDIGAHLKEKFDGASMVKVNRRRNRLLPADSNFKKPTKKDLVYMEESPDFCENNLKLGIMGTQGRLCNKTSYGLDGCTIMCCGRGYGTVIEDLVEDCDCKFFWCCKVICQKCKRKVEKHYCH